MGLKLGYQSTGRKNSIGFVIIVLFLIRKQTKLREMRVTMNKRVQKHLMRGVAMT